LQNARITRPGYGIEYDIVDPINLYPTLMSKSVPNLFLAGQINGTSGYEEAAGQGLLAGINAAAFALGRSQLVLDANNSYLGLMVQEITTLGITEPYRIFTSRSPFRLNLRMSNAEERLSRTGYESGLLSDEAIMVLEKRVELINEIESNLNSYSFLPAQLKEEMPELADPVPSGRVTLAQLLKRPDVSLKKFAGYISGILELDQIAILEVEARIKYSGYFIQQQKEFELRDSMALITLEEKFFQEIPEAVSREARMKILAVRPHNIAALANIPGVRASDLALILMTLKKRQVSVNRNE